MSRIDLPRAASWIGRNFAAGAVFAALCAPAFGAGAPPIGDRYDAYVKTVATPKFSFGNDADVKGSLIELGKSLVSNLPLPEAEKGPFTANLGESIVNAYEFWDDVDASIKKGEPGPTKQDLAEFMAKMVLVNASKSEPKDFEKIAKALGLSDESAEVAIEASAGFAKAAGEAGAQATGHEAIEAIKTAELAAIDELCTPCEVSRNAVLVGIEASKALYGQVQDDIADKEYRRWKDGDATLTFVGRGYAVPLQQAHEALIVAWKHQGKGEPTDADLDKFIRGKFQSFDRLEKSRQDDAALIAAAKDNFLKLTDVERAQFGATDDERIANFANQYLQIYKTMIAYKGAKTWPLGLGEAGFRAAVVDIVKNKMSISAIDLKQRVAADLRNWGWLAPSQAGPAEIIRVRQRLAALNYTKLKALLDYMNVSVPNQFFNCMCGQIPHGVGVGFVYDAERCKADGCHFVGGFGDFCSPMPSGEAAWNACAPKTGVGYKSAAEPGTPIDQYIAQELAKAKR